MPVQLVPQVEPDLLRQRLHQIRPHVREPALHQRQPDDQQRRPDQEPPVPADDPVVDRPRQHQRDRQLDPERREQRHVDGDHLPPVRPQIPEDPQDDLQSTLPPVTPVTPGVPAHAPCRGSQPSTPPSAPPIPSSAHSTRRAAPRRLPSPEVGGAPPGPCPLDGDWGRGPYPTTHPHPPGAHSACGSSGKIGRRSAR